MSLAWGVLRQSLALGIAEFTTIYSVKSWLSSWLVRMLAQVGFFGSIGLMVQREGMLSYLLIGNAVAIICLEANIIVLSASGERYYGTVSAIMATPAQPVIALLGRGMHWVLSGTVTSMITLSILPLVFGVSLSPMQLLACLPVVLTVGICCYGYGSALGGLTLRFPQWDWLIMNLGYLTVMTIAGVNVPVSFWPRPIQVLAELLPVTHGLRAVRAIAAGEPLSPIIVHVGWEILVGIGWFAAATVSYAIFVRHARTRGAAG